MREYVTEEPKTICVKCVHFTASQVYCGSVTALKQRDANKWSVITGELQHTPIRCEDVNDGDCPHFKPKA